MWELDARLSGDRNETASPEPLDQFCPCVSSVLAGAAFIGPVSGGIVPLCLKKHHLVLTLVDYELRKL